MATKEAGIKLTLNGSGFVSGMKAAEGEVKGSAGRMGAALKTALSNGVKGGVESLKSAFSTIKSTIGMIGGLAGGIGVIELARGAVMAEGAYRKLAFQINKSGTASVTFRELQQQSQAAALRWGQANEELGAAMSDVFRETGDAKFAQAAIEKIAIAATGAHEPVRTIGSIAGTLNEKFGITSEQIGDAMATVVGLADKGGVGMDELAGKLGMVGAVAKKAGLSGQEGFSEMIGMLNLADDGGKNLRKNLIGIEGVFEQLATKQGRLKAFSAAGIQGKQTGNVAKDIGAIVKATGGSREKLEKGGFSGEQISFLAEMGKKAKASGESFEDALRKAGTSALTFADLQKEASAEMETSEKKAAVAMEKLRQTFSKPEITAAINKLMEQLPALADLIEKVVSFAVEHPALAAGIAVGGIAAKGAAEGMIGSAITAAFARGGVTAAGSLAGAFSAGGIGLAAAIGPLLIATAALYATYKIIEAISEADAQREKDKADAEAAGKRVEEGGGGTDGAGAESGSSVTFRDLETGQLVTKTADEFDDPQEFDAIKEKQRLFLEEQDATAGLLSPGQEDAQNFLDPNWGSGTRLPPEKAGKADQSIDFRLLADMLGMKTLKTQITNWDDMPGGPGGPPGMPPPVNVPRR